MLSDLELLNQVIADHARQLTERGCPQPQQPEIKDDAIRFFAQQLQAAPSLPSLPSVNQPEPPALDI